MYKKTNNQEGSVLITERLIISLFYMSIIVHTSGKKHYEQKNAQKWGLLARMHGNGDY